MTQGIERGGTAASPLDVRKGSAFPATTLFDLQRGYASVPAVEAELKANYKIEPILNVNVDPELLGGMVVQVGDWVFDTSVKSRLERLRNQLMAGSYHVQDR